MNFYHRYNEFLPQAQLIFSTGTGNSEHKYSSFLIQVQWIVPDFPCLLFPDFPDFPADFPCLLFQISQISLISLIYLSACPAAWPAAFPCLLFGQISQISVISLQVVASFFVNWQLRLPPIPDSGSILEPRWCTVEIKWDPNRTLVGMRSKIWKY